MHFQHSAGLWRDFPALVPGVLYAEGITASAEVKTGPYEQAAKKRLAGGPESELPEIQAWRRAFATLGLKPTQYRCAAESLLRRFARKASCPGCTRSSTCATPRPDQHRPHRGRGLARGRRPRRPGTHRRPIADIGETWRAKPQSAILTAAAPSFQQNP
jgi:hypothetical protein